MTDFQGYGPDEPLVEELKRRLEAAHLLSIERATDLKALREVHAGTMGDLAQARARITRLELENDDLEARIRKLALVAMRLQEMVEEAHAKLKEMIELDAQLGRVKP